MSKLFMKYEMQLLHLNRAMFSSKIDSLPDDIQLVEANNDNLHLIKEDTKNAHKHGIWQRYLKKGARGVFAVCGDTIIGYGWLKSKGIKDPFYVLGGEVAYLGEFFVVEEFRGRSIYPAMVSWLIEMSEQYNDFYVSAYTSSHSSLRGLAKVGFGMIKTLVFKRAFKMTLNKYKII